MRQELSPRASPSLMLAKASVASTLCSPASASNLCGSKASTSASNESAGVSGLCSVSLRRSSRQVPAAAPRCSPGRPCNQLNVSRRPSERRQRPRLPKSRGVALARFPHEHRGLGQALLVLRPIVVQALRVLRAHAYAFTLGAFQRFQDLWFPRRYQLAAMHMPSTALRGLPCNAQSSATDDASLAVANIGFMS